MTLSTPIRSASKPPRDVRLDLLKVLGLMGILAAHAIEGSDPNPIAKFLSEFRNFDVPLMIVISGVLFAKSAPAEGIPWWTYLKKRIPRLIAPVWMFLIIFFILGRIISQVSGDPYPFTFRDIVGSFLLINYISIGYVWVVRAFFLVAVVSPLLWSWKLKINNNILFLALLAIVYLVYDALSRVILPINLDGIAPETRWLNIIIARIFLFLIIHQIVFYLISFSFMFAVGMIIPELKRKTLLAIALLFGVVYGIWVWFYIQKNGSFVSTYIDKFPPQLYYVSYGIFMSLLVYLGLSGCRLSHRLRQWTIIQSLIASIQFISQSSLWIYLWHIALIYYGNVFFSWFDIDNTAPHRWLYWAVASITITRVQKTLVSAIAQNPAVGPQAQTYLSILFLK